MKRLSIATALLAGLFLAGCAPKNTFIYEGNPLVRDKYTADPAPMVASDGRLYMFCGHDECFEDRPGYEGKYGSAPSGHFSTSHYTDGTVALCGAIGSIAFAPEIVVPTIDYYYTALDGKLFGGYGFYDSYNLEKGVWIAKDVIGIDKGVSLLMIENYQSEFVWEVFMDCEFMDTAIEVLKFKKA